jgi:ribose transport system permease protein
VVAGLGGLLLTSQLSTGDPTVGPGYLLPVIAAVFLGSTQFRGGRFNIWGTVVAAYVLAVGVKGLQLAGLPIWIPDLFNGAALLLAVGLAAWRRPPVTRREAIRRLIRNNTTTAWARKRARRTELIDRVATTGAVTAPDHPAAGPSSQAVHRESWPVRLRRAVAFRNVSALYLLAFMFVVFALWVPDTFLTAGTWRSLLSNQAITCLVAVGLVIPTAAGVIDLAIGAEVGLGTILVAWLLVGHVPIAAAVVLSLLAGAAVGIFSWLMITRARIPSFIATLAVSSLLAAATAWVSSSEQIINLPAGFSRLGNGQLFGITYPVYIMVAVALLLWYVLERTPAGRRVYATGGNPQAAALAGVRTSRIILFALVTSGVVAGLGGLLLTSQLSTGDPTVGPGYLLPVIAAVFLGSTQFRGGRFNIWGTVVAAYVLAVGVKGLQLAGLPIWIPDLFNGAALLVAVGLAAWRRTPSTRRMGLDRFVRLRPGARQTTETGDGRPSPIHSVRGS